MGAISLSWVVSSPSFIHVYTLTPSTSNRFSSMSAPENSKARTIVEYPLLAALKGTN